MNEDDKPEHSTDTMGTAPAKPESASSAEASIKPVIATGTTTIPVAKSPTDGPVEHEMMQGATLSLLVGAFFPCIPIAIICSVLLSIILGNEIKPPFSVVERIIQTHTTSTVNETLTAIENLKRGGSSVYWLWARQSTTPGTLHTIASVTGKVMPFITSTSMALVAFFAGRRIIQASKHEKHDSMPTPYQMSLLISLLNGSSTQPLWLTIRYRWRTHVHLVYPVLLAFWALTWIVAATLAIQAVDTWFGIATQPATVDILKTTNTTLAFGRQLDPTICNTLYRSLPCISDSSATCDYPCSITTWNSSSDQARFGLQHAQEAAQVLMNNSLTDFVINVSTSSSVDTQHYFLGDIRSSASHDFTTDTLAVTTQCKMITQDCDLGTGFTCGTYTAPSFAWTGAVGIDTTLATGPTNQSNAGIQFFADTLLTLPIGRANSSHPLFAAQNPVPFLVWSKGFPPVDTLADQFAYMRDSRYLGSDASGDPVFILNCSMAIYHAAYNWTDGGVSPINGLYDLQLAEPAYGAIFSAGFAMDTALSHLSLQDAVALAAYKDTPEGLSSVFANQFSHAAVALTTGITAPSRNIYDVERYNRVLVTRVPKLPLYFLIALKAIYALFALVLAVLASLYAEPYTSQDVKERLTIDGLAVGLFEADSHLKSGVREIEQLFAEHERRHEGTEMEKVVEANKVGMVQNVNGGWTWQTTRMLGEVFGVGVAVDEVKGRIVGA